MELDSSNSVFNHYCWDLDVKVVYDGSNFQAEWAPTAEYQQKALEEGLQELFDN